MVDLPRLADQTAPATGTDHESRVQSRARTLFAEHRQKSCREVDRMFAVLMGVQWVGAIVIAVLTSPRASVGTIGQAGGNIWAAIVLGGLISGGPILLAILKPGSTLTRQVIAISQGLWAALLLHLSGGRVETHFHVFASLAYLAFYRDWRVIVTASLVVAGDHLIRGSYFPQSVYGAAVHSPLRWLELTAWILMEDIVLLITCDRGIRDTEDLCTHRARLELTNEQIEQTVTDRTAALTAANEKLSIEIQTREAAQAREAELGRERDKVQADLLVASRSAGMAETATGILHNVGNVLNSVNVSANLINDRLQSSRVTQLSKATQLLSHDDLPRFLSEDEKGQRLPGYLTRVAEVLREENSELLGEIRSLRENVDHIKQVVQVQQEYAQRSGAVESVVVEDLLENAAKVTSASANRHAIDVIREYDHVSAVNTEKHKVLQILVNLMSNAKNAINEFDGPERVITLRTTETDDQIHITVEDTGFGIAPENLSQIFTHGFTTRREGHGFGLHSSANAASELGGSLIAASDGPGLGASFTLSLPHTMPTAKPDLATTQATR